MISIFTKFDFIETPSIINNKFQYVKERFKYELENTIEYYRYRNGKVKNTNMLVRLITTASPNYNKDIFDFMRTLDGTVLQYTKTFEIASIISTGSILNNVMFGKNSLELFVYREDDIDIMSLEEEWRDLRPIEVVKYDGTDTFLTMPSETKELNYNSLSIFKIDIRKLLVQYRYWALERLHNDFDTDPAVFIYTYVFPNVMPSLLDFSILNRFKAIVNEEDIIPSTNQHPFNILDLNRNLDKALLDIKQHLMYENKTYNNILKNIPMVDSEHAYDLVFNSEVGNRQNKWALFLIMLPHLDLLIDMSGPKTFKANKLPITEITKLLKQLSRDRSLDHIDNDFIELEVNMSIDLLKHNLEER